MVHALDGVVEDFGTAGQVAGVVAGLMRVAGVASSAALRSLSLDEKPMRARYVQPKRVAVKDTRLEYPEFKSND